MDRDDDAQLGAGGVLGDAVVRAALCDPRRWFREALAHRLNDEPDIRVLWTMADPAELADAPWVADVLVLSLGEHPERRTLGALAELAERHPTGAVVGLTASPEQAASLWPRVCRGGVRDLVPRTAGVPALADALRRAGAGRGLADGERRPPERRVRTLLSPREQEVLEWLAAGRTVVEIADGLGVRPKTVANCKQRLYRKLGVHHQAHAVAAALHLGLLVPDVPDRALAAWS